MLYFIRASSFVGDALVLDSNIYRATWRVIPPSEETSFRRGDVDSNGSVEITDPVRILAYLFLGNGEPECLEAADTDDDGTVDISDAISSLAYQFTGGPPPALPGPVGCGADPEGSKSFLGCEAACR
jgi:hypothetical protein